MGSVGLIIPDGGCHQRASVPKGDRAERDLRREDYELRGAVCPCSLEP